MRLPDVGLAVVAEAKITKYLLSTIHREGRHKEPFFTRHGFRLDSWHILAEALLRHAGDHEVREVKANPHGLLYVIEGRMPAPDGRAPNLRSVWIIKDLDPRPSFVTAYPLPEEVS